MPPRSKYNADGGSATQTPPPAEEVLETGEPIADEIESGEKKIAGKKGSYLPRGANRAEQVPPPEPGQGQMVLASAKFLNTNHDPAVDRANKRRERARQAEETSNSNGGALSLEKGIFNSGVAGGLLAMGGAVVWFIAGLANDVIFFYPPILFVIGLAALGKGLMKSKN